jgi:hypothetical protein
MRFPEWLAGLLKPAHVSGSARSISRYTALELDWNTRTESFYLSIKNTGFSQSHLKIVCPFGNLFEGLLLDADIISSATP